MKNKKIIFKFLPITIILFVSVLLTYSIFKEIKNLGFSLSILKPSYTVVFNSNGGTGSMENQTFKIGISQNLRTNTFTRTDYTFNGWNTEPDGTGNSYTDGESVNNLANQNGATVNLYAIWRANDLTITYDSNGGSTPSFETKTIAGGSTEYGQMPTTTKAGYSLLGWSLNKIPDDYQELEYIEFNAGTYINTGIIPSNHTIEIKFDYGEYLSNESLFGTTTTNSTEKYYIYTSSNKYLWPGGSSSVISGNHIMIFNDENSGIKLDGNTLATNLTLTATTSLLLGKRGGYANFTGKVYYVKIIDKTSGDVVRDYIPCYRRSDGALGLYDKTNEIFYPDSDSTAQNRFTKGNNIDYINATTNLQQITNHTIYAAWARNPQVSFDANGGTPVNTIKSVNYGEEYGLLPTTSGDTTFKGWKITENYLPDEYQEVEYIRFVNGSYIDTGVIPIDHYTEVKFDFEGHKDSEHLFGTETSGSNYHFSVSYNKYIVKSNTTIDYNWAKGTHILKYNADYNKVFLDNDLISISNRLYDNERSILIGRSGTANFEGIIYYFKIVNNRTGDIERNFIPCYRKSDNEIGLYDTIQNKFYTNNGTGTFEKGENVNYITSESIVNIVEDHTLHAIWEEPKYTVNITVTNGSSNVSSKQVYKNAAPTFELSTPLTTYISTVTCTNGQKATILNDILTVKNVTNNTTCTVTYSNAGSTVLYTDGTLIINEKSEDRADNIITHGSVTNEYNAMSNTENYVFSSASNVLWYNERNNIKKIEIGQKIAPLSTSYWFQDLQYVSEGDFTNLDTSRVNNMKYMLKGSGSHSSVTSYILTGLDNWDTTEVTDMRYMFKSAGANATTWSIGNLSNWNTMKVDNMDHMFESAGQKANVLSNNIGTIDIYTDYISCMFRFTYYLSATVNIFRHYSDYYLNHSYFVESAATKPGTEMTINYDCSIGIIDDIINTKSSGSNVIKGNSSGTCEVKLILHDGTSDDTTKYVPANSNPTFTITPDNEGSVPAVFCTNNQIPTISGNTLTISSINMITTCNIYYEDTTTLYQDGTLIINESTLNRAANQLLHGNTANVYDPLSNDNAYEFTSSSNVLWYNERYSIRSIEIGQPISPTSTAYWFYDAKYLSRGDFTNIDTSNVTSMRSMFNSTGTDSSVTSYVLTGLDTWDTSEVQTMYRMFTNAGNNATTWSIGNLTSWSNEKVTNMESMFSGAAAKASTSMTSIGNIYIYATNTYQMFYNANYMKADLYLYNNISSGSSGYNGMLSGASTKTGALITVNYSCSTTNIDKIIATKSTASNVVKGTGFGICTANLEVNGGTSDETEKTNDINNDIEFTITPYQIGSNPTIYCTNNQRPSIDGNKLTIDSISFDTTCTIYYGDATLVYNDGTLIINEPNDSTRVTNQLLHGDVIHMYEPFSNDNNYVFTNESKVPWNADLNDISRVEIGQQISPTSTAYWFSGLKYLSSGDFTNLDTSNVTTMKAMFSGAGNNSSVTSFTLTGLDTWDTDNVLEMTNMFSSAGRYAKTWSIGDLSSWNTQNVTTMASMFYYAANSASTSMTSIGSLDIYATNVYQMFYYSQYMQATLNIYSNPASGSSGYNGMFYYAANKTGALITVNYSSTTTNIDNIIGTKSSSSNVVKGIQLN